MDETKMEPESAPNGTHCETNGLHKDLGSICPSERSSPAVEVKRFLDTHPVIKKAFAAGLIAASGEVIAGFLKRKDPRPAGGPSRQRAVFAFFVFGVLNGVCFHWWYNQLEKLCKKHPTTETVGMSTRLAYDRLLFTPPLLMIQIAFLHFLQNLNPSAALKHAKSMFFGALLMNWKVWTPAQFLNFAFVPVHMRVMFGSMVALWWNIYLSMMTKDARS